MSVKIRLQRFGRRKKAYYHIVAADARAPRDGKFIERIGSYNPNTNPATIDLDLDRAVQWLQNGAQPTDTARAILSYKGAMMKHHLLAGVRKGAMTEEQAEAKFNEWLQEKLSKIRGKEDSILSAKDEATKARLASEAKVSEERAKRIAAKNAPEEPEAEETSEVEESAAPEETAEAAAPAPEAPAEEAEAKEEPAVEEKAEEAEPAKEEAKEEPAAEEKAEEAEPAKEEEAPAEEAKADEAAEAPAEEEKK